MPCAIVIYQHSIDGKEAHRLLVDGWTTLKVECMGQYPMFESASSSTSLSTLRESEPVGFQITTTFGPSSTHIYDSKQLLVAVLSRLRSVDLRSLEGREVVPGAEFTRDTRTT
jgi:hypothetical protein